MTCPCVNARPRAGHPTIHGFAEVRERCPALLQVFLPAPAWETLVAMENQPPDAALHASSLLLAFVRGRLASLTGPVHRFLLEGNQPRANLTTQYRKDLQEQWWSAPNEALRHERARIFFGKVVELQLASWLVDEGWTVSALEALGGPADIVAESPAQESHSFEVKYIGWQTDDFLRVVDALAGGDGGGAIPVLGGVPLYLLEAANYLVFRVYEAARRLQQCPGTRTAAVVIDALSWRCFAQPLRERWISWNAPAFLAAGDQWREFLNAQRQHLPELDAELPAAISSLDHLWVFKYTDYECVLEHCASPATSA